jgi:hypothetical protein
MKKSIVTLVRLGSLVAVLEMTLPAQADLGRNSIGPSISSSNSSSFSFGIDSKFGISDHISVRPFAYFPSGGTNVGSELTFDFNFKTRDGFSISPFLGGSVAANSGGNGNNKTTFGLVGGADFPVSDSFGLKAALNVPLSNGSGQTAGITLGAGLRF